MNSSIKNKRLSQKNIYTLLFLVILLLAIVSRMTGLTFQSYWYDELYIMNVANPTNTISDILEDMKVEFHPPLHYYVSHFFFKVFGYNDFSGRFLSAIIGILGVIAIFFLGIEIKNKRTGFLLALLTTINYHHLYHSQEVRMYISLFLLTVLSALFFLKMLRKDSLLNTAFYILFTTLNLYTHYFGIIVFGAQAAFMVHLYMVSKDRRFFIRNLIVLFIIGVMYLPWLPFILEAGGRSHWMTTPQIWYFFVYLYGQLGKEPVSFLIFIFGLALFIQQFFAGSREGRSSSDLSRYYVLYSLIFVYFLTYIISIFKPILIMRCVISGLPFLFLAVVLGIGKFTKKISNIVFLVLFISTVVNLLFINKYYSRVTKPDFRGVIEQVKKVGNENTLYISAFDKYLNYYFLQYDLKSRSVEPEGDAKDFFSGQDNFFILNAHNDSTIMSMYKFKIYADYIDANYMVDTVIKTKTEYEYLTRYKLK